MARRLVSALLFLVCHAAVLDVHAEETIHPFAPDSFRKIVASEAGKPFVVMVWSLDCAYCQPSFDALAKAKRNHQVNIVTIATDRADDPEASHLARKKLEASGLGSNMWAFGTMPAEQLRYAIDPTWRGELPRSYWFNARGEAAAHSGMITADTVAKFLAK